MQRVVSLAVLLLGLASCGDDPDSPAAPAQDAVRTELTAPEPEDVAEEPAPEAIPDPSADADADGDGLSDYQERHKYLTDPASADTDGDGVGDGDWVERREHTYTIRFVTRVLPPAEAIRDDWQDARVLDRCNEYVELEIVVYPLGTPDTEIPRARERESMAAAHPARVTANMMCNFDAEMRATLLADLAEAGIEPDALNDRDLVERVTAWAMRDSEFVSAGFCIPLVGVVDGAVAPLPELVPEFQRRKLRNDPARTDAEQLALEALGKEMYAQRRHGSCTSSAVYLANILRCIGVPTLQTRAIPPADASNDDQVQMLARGVRHPQIRAAILEAMERLGRTDASHNFNIAFVGGRWRRLNYSDLGPKLVDANYMGLLLRTLEFDDLAVSGFAEAKARLATGEIRGEQFRGPNHYRLMDVTDRVGEHATISFPVESPATVDEPASGDQRDHAMLTIGRLAWREHPGDAGLRVLAAHVTEWFDDQNGDQYKRFTQRVDRHFDVRDGERTILSIECAIGSITGSGGLHAVVFLLDQEEIRRLPADRALRLVPRNGGERGRWAVEPGAVFTRP